MADQKQQLKERTCFCCGKEFIFHDDWVYKDVSGTRTRLFCSWGCLRKWEKQRGSLADRKEKIRMALKDGLTVNEVSKLLDEDYSMVLYQEKKLKQETA